MQSPVLVASMSPENNLFLTAHFPHTRPSNVASFGECKSSNAACVNGVLAQNNGPIQIPISPFLFFQRAHFIAHLGLLGTPPLGSLP